MKQKIYIIGLISSAVLITGTIFKLNHWPAAAILITLGTVILLGAFLPSALINHYRANGNKETLLLYIVTYVTCFVVITGMLFKILHWPFAGVLILIAVPFPFVVFLPVWLYVTSKIRNFDINNTIFILFLLTLQSVFSVALSLNITREKLFSTMQIDRQLIKQNRGIALFQQFNNESALERSANDVLKEVSECRKILYYKSGLSADGISEGNFNSRYLDLKDRPVDLLLTSSDNSPGIKLNNALIVFVKELGKLPGGESMAKEANYIFNLNAEAGDNTPWIFRMWQGRYLTWILTDLDGIENYVRILSLSAIN